MNTLRLVSVAWVLAIEQWTTHARTQGWAETTVRTRLDHLHRDARHIGVEDPWLVTAEHLVAWFKRQRWSQETRRGHRATLRSFYGWGEREGYVERSPALALPRVRPAKPRPRPTPDSAYVGALAAASRRERLMLRLGAEVGMRRAEVAVVWPERDLVEDLQGWSLVVHGKGGKDRVVPLTDLMAAELLAMPAGYAFPGADNGHLSPRWVGTLVSRLLPQGWTMHSLRHRFAARSYEVDRDLVVLQELLGHDSITTTRIYVPVVNERLRKTVNAAAGTGPVQQVA